MKKLASISLLVLIANVGMVSAAEQKTENKTSTSSTTVCIPDKAGNANSSAQAEQQESVGKKPTGTVIPLNK